VRFTEKDVARDPGGRFDTKRQSAPDERLADAWGADSAATPEPGASEQDALLTVETPECMTCGKGGTVTVNAEGLRRWRAGMLIQQALPEMSADEREQLMTGTHAACWEAMFGEE
jgi:hypothetical protein